MPKNVFLSNVEKIIKYKKNLNEPMPKKKQDSCDICFLQLSSKQAVTRHMKIIHSENKNDYGRISSGHIIPFGDSQDIISFHLIVSL